MNDLNMKEQSFVLEYMKSKNATQAAKNAGYQGTPGSLRVMASKLLTKGNILAAIQAMTKPIVQQANISTERVVNELARYAFGELEDFVKIQYNMEGDVVGAKLILKDKLMALRMLGDHLGMFKDVPPMDNERPNLHLHFHPNMSPEDARQRLLNYLRNRK